MTRDDLRKVEYYASEKYVPDAGYDDDVDLSTPEGLFHRFADSFYFDNGQRYAITEAIIEDPETQEIKQIWTKRLIKFL